MLGYMFSVTRILHYKDRIVDFVLIRENMDQWKHAFSHILCSVICAETHIAILQRTS